MQLPVLQDIPKCRAWAANVGNKATYHAPAPPLWTRRLDAVFLHPVAGPLIFLLVVVAVFQTIFSWAEPLMDAVQLLIQWSGRLDELACCPPAFCARCWSTESGAASDRCIVFLPQILLLFLFIGILEDSGYLARAALIADRTMARFGLQGKIFIPLLSAYACAVPAIMATRTIENKRDRIATILIAPFMTCSARLPVYTLIIAAFIRIGRCSVRSSAPAPPPCWACTCSAFSPRSSPRASAQIVRFSRASARRSCWRCLPTAGPLCASLGPALDRPLEGLPAPRRHRDSGRGHRPLGARAPAAARRPAPRTSSTASPARSATPSSRSSGRSASTGRSASD